MITCTNFPNVSISPDRNNLLPLSEAAIFDIETTGFSPKTASVYLIGVLYFREKRWQMVQFLAESPNEEPSLLAAFLSFIKDFPALIHFNGNRFDLPFLQKRCAQFSMDCPLDTLESMDLYQFLRPLKRLLKLPALNLKTFEHFLLLKREDMPDGGQLISVYHRFCENPTEGAKNLLLLHNHDDLTGTLSLCSLIPYRMLLEGQFELSASPELDSSGDEFSLIFHLSLENPVPHSISLDFEQGYLTVQNKVCRLLIHGMQGTLKYFFPDYKNYYFLPEEDMAIHKSLGTYVDKTHRQPAKASNCYCKKAGLFLPGNGAVSGPHFKSNYKDETFYVEYSADFSRDLALQKAYLQEFLTQLKC